MNDSASSVEAKRMQACSFLISAWCSSLLAPPLNSTPLQRLACLPALTHLLKYFADHPTNAKKILAAAVEVCFVSDLNMYAISGYPVTNSESY